MTTKRTHGPCTCAKASIPSLEGHQSDCPALYPAQQEPDALTRLVRHIRDGLGSGDETPWASKALDLIAEAREEQMKAISDLAHIRRQRAHVARLLGVADGGEWQNDWEAPVPKALARARDEGLENAATVFIAEENEADRMAAASNSAKRRVDWLARAGEMGSSVRRIRAKKVGP